MKPEFSRSERIDTIGAVPRPVEVEADEAERAALAARFGLIAIHRLVARLAVRREGNAILADGQVEGDVIQACSVTDEPIPVAVAESVALRFAEETDAEGEIELSEDALDTIPIENGAIDLGEAAAETLALALDPFPRAPGAAKALREAGVIGEDEVRPFNAFADLKAKLAGN